MAIIVRLTSDLARRIADSLHREASHQPDDLRYPAIATSLREAAAHIDATSSRPSGTADPPIPDIRASLNDDDEGSTSFEILSSA
jgi:hypothetical protein